MLRKIFEAACTERLSERLLQAVIVNLIIIEIKGGSLSFVEFDQVSGEFCQKYGTAITQDSTVLLASVSNDFQLAKTIYTALEHNCARLIHRDCFISKLGVVIGYTTIAILDRFLTIARIHYVNEFLQITVNFLSNLILEAFLVD